MFSELQPVLFNTTVKEAKKYLMNMFEYYSDACYKTNEQLFLTYKSYVKDFYNSTDVVKSKDAFFKQGKAVLKKFPKHHLKAFGYYAQRYFPVQQGVLNVPSNYPCYHVEKEKIEATLVAINKIIEITANGATTYYFKPIDEYDMYSASDNFEQLIPTTSLKQQGTIDLNSCVKNIVQTNVNPYKVYCDKLLIKATDSTVNQRFQTVLSANTEQIQNFIKKFIQSTEVFSLFSNHALYSAIDYLTYQPEAKSSAGPKLVKSLYDEMIVKAMNYFVVLPFEPLNKTYTINTYDTLNGCNESSLNDSIYKF
jgi:hypothetical protein